jgi:hypothetical protein
VGGALLILVAGGVLRCSGDQGGEGGPGSLLDPGYRAYPNDTTVQAPSRGRFARLRVSTARSSLTAAQREDIRRLQSLGYASGTAEPVTDQVITVYRRDRVDTAPSFYTSGHGPEASLIDMSGNELHRWRFSLQQVWPEMPVSERVIDYWRRAHLFENGDLLVIFANTVRGIFKLDKGSNLIWANTGIATHHDLDVTDGGDIYVLTRKAHLVPRVHPELPILEDFVTILDAGGRVRKSVSTLEAMERSEYAHLWSSRLAECKARLEDTDCRDIFHTNSVQLLDGRIADRVPAFRAGNVLTSFRHLNAIAVIDMELEQVVWLHTGDYRAQHDPRVIENGNLILFDNRGRPGQSRVLEIDPLSGETVWEYGGTPEAPFFSIWCGAATRLPNGNTLISESENGRAFEVTSDKEIVWEFYNPHRAGEDRQFVGVLFELVRLPSDFPIDWASNR